MFAQVHKLAIFAISYVSATETETLLRIFLILGIVLMADRLCTRVAIATYRVIKEMVKAVVTAREWYVQLERACAAALNKACRRARMTIK